MAITISNQLHFFCGLIDQLILMSSILPKVSLPQIDSDLMIILDSSTSAPDLPSVASNIGAAGAGAVWLVDVDQAPYNSDGYKLLLSGYGTVVLVSVSTRNIERTLRLLDSSIEKNSTRIIPGIWNKMVIIVKTE